MIDSCEVISVNPDLYISPEYSHPAALCVEVGEGCATEVPKYKEGERGFLYFLLFFLLTFLIDYFNIATQPQG